MNACWVRGNTSSRVQADELLHHAWMCQAEHQLQRGKYILQAAPVSLCVFLFHNIWHRSSMLCLSCQCPCSQKPHRRCLIQDVTPCKQPTKQGRMGVSSSFLGSHKRFRAELGKECYSKCWMWSFLLWGSQLGRWIFQACVHNIRRAFDGLTKGQK